MSGFFRILRIAMVVGLVATLASCEMMGMTTGSSGSSSGSLPVVSASYSGTTTTRSTISLDGTATTGANSYYWTITSRPTGSYCYISSSYNSSASFVPDAAGTYKVQLAATNSAGTSNKTLSIVITLGAPVAVAAYSGTTTVGQYISLNGYGSTDATSYLWTIVSKPTGSNISITNSATYYAYFYPDLPGTYKFQLAASNSTGTSTATVSITVTGGTLSVTVN